MALALTVGLGCAAGPELAPLGPSLRRFLADHELLFARLATPQGLICAEISTSPDRLSVRLDGDGAAPQRLSWRYAVGARTVVIDAVSSMRFHDGQGIGSLRACRQVLTVRSVNARALVTAQGSLHTTSAGCRADPRPLELGTCTVQPSAARR